MHKENHKKIIIRNQKVSVIYVQLERNKILHTFSENFNILSHSSVITGN